MKTRRNLQVEQPNVKFPPEGNGWPTPLTDESDPVRYSYTTGKSGETISKPVTDVQATK